MYICIYKLCYHMLYICESRRMVSPPWSPFVDSKSRTDSQWDAAQRRSQDDLHGSILKARLNKQRFLQAQSTYNHPKVHSSPWGGLALLAASCKSQKWPALIYLGAPPGLHNPNVKFIVKKRRKDYLNPGLPNLGYLIHII